MNPKAIGQVIAQELIWENREDKKVSDDSIEKECYFAVADLKADIKEEVIKTLEENGYAIW